MECSSWFASCVMRNNQQLFLGLSLVQRSSPCVIVVLLLLFLELPTTTKPCVVGLAFETRYEGTSRRLDLPDDIFHHHPAMSVLTTNLRPRSRLKPRHESLFVDYGGYSHPYFSVFNQLGRLCCQMGVVSRKEFLENYAAATLIHQHFPNVARVADVAAGHGLLAWFLLVLYNSNSNNINDNKNKGTNTTTTATTAVCIDRSMPAAAERIAAVMQETFPTLSWSYVQADLAACIPHPSCLLVSVHACGTLTDDLIAMAIHDNVPCAIVPCCHTLRSGIYQPHVLAGISTEQVTQQVQAYKATLMDDDKHLAVATVVDQVRYKTLQRAHFDVQIAWLPDTFTPKNRLFLASPSLSLAVQAQSNTSCSSKSGNILSIEQLHQSLQQGTFFERQEPSTNRGQNNATSSNQHERQSPTPKSLRIPLGNDPKSIATCKRLSGKDQAWERLTQQIPRHFSFTLALSVWLDHDSVQQDDEWRQDKGAVFSAAATIWLEELKTLVDETILTNNVHNLQCHVECDIATQSEKQGRRSQLYKFCYTRVDGGGMSGPPRQQAKDLHQVLRAALQERYGNLR